MFAAVAGRAKQEISRFSTPNREKRSRTAPTGPLGGGRDILGLFTGRVLPLNSVGQVGLLAAAKSKVIPTVKIVADSVSACDTSVTQNER